MNNHPAPGQPENGPDHAGSGAGVAPELIDLIVQETTEGLTQSDRTRLDGANDPAVQKQREQLERAAAAAALAFADAKGDLPSLSTSLRDRLLRDAQNHLPPQKMADGALPAPFRAEVAPVVAGVIGPATRRTTWNNRLGWFAAAAGIALAAAAWWPASRPNELASAQTRLALLVKEAADVVRLPWKSDQDGFKGVTGEVVWSDARQEGYMRLTGMPINDAKSVQYQLWIIDPGRDTRPVDGGVFDITKSGEIIVPIVAKLRVDKPEGFALTREKPGGVVVSKGPLLVIASRS